MTALRAALNLAVQKALIVPLSGSWSSSTAMQKSGETYSLIWTSDADLFKRRTAR